MMESADKSSKSEYNALDDLSIPPEDMLEMLVPTLRRHLHSIGGWAEILQMEELVGEHPTALEMIPLNVQQMHNILDETLKYIEKRKALNAGKGDTES